jgi:hypothetical protein
MALFDKKMGMTNKWNRLMPNEIFEKNGYEKNKWKSTKLK